MHKHEVRSCRKSPQSLPPRLTHWRLVDMYLGVAHMHPRRYVQMSMYLRKIAAQEGAFAAAQRAAL